MDERAPAVPDSGRGRGRWLLLMVVAALVVVSAAIAVTVILLTGRSETPALPPAVQAPAPATCAGYLVVYVGTDEEATSTVAALHDDPQVVTTFVETREQAYARFKEVFKDRPDLLDQVRPESLPASVSLVPAGSIDLEQWATRIRARFPTAQQVAVMDGAKAPDTMKAALDKLQVHLCPPGR